MESFYGYFPFFGVRSGVFGGTDFFVDYFCPHLGLIGHFFGVWVR